MNTFSVQSQSAAELIYVILGCIIVNGLRRYAGIYNVGMMEYARVIVLLVCDMICIRNA